MTSPHLITTNMTIFQSVFLGIVQGLTEFIPVSSSAHLVLVPHLFGWRFPPTEAFIFNVLVQVATLMAVFVYYWKDLAAIVMAFLTALSRKQPFGDPQARLGWYILLATLPAGLIGFALKEAVERAFDNPTATALFLFLTAALLLAAEKWGQRNRHLEKIIWKDALWIGIFQAIAIFPGISRSGATITGGMARGLERSSAARFSFLLSIPILLSAGVLAISDLIKIPDFIHLMPTLWPGLIASALTGYLAIRWLLRYLTRHSLTIFALYCIGLALLVLITTWF